MSEEHREDPGHLLPEDAWAKVVAEAEWLRAEAERQRNGS